MSDMDSSNPEYDYPTDEQQLRIKEWDMIEAGVRPLIEYVESLWWQPGWGFRIRRGRHRYDRKLCMKLELHTGGWSGNETIMDALHHNFIFWSLCWYKHITGGHYWFEISMAMWERK